LDWLTKLILTVILNAPLSTRSNKHNRPVSPASIVFGSRILGPAEKQARKEDIEAHSEVINGVKIPPKPDEPDNCCMSGCIHCVWDLYREDMELWAGQRKLAMAQGAKSKREGGAVDNAEQESEPDPSSLFDDIPIGIRQFMATEKMLRERHLTDSFQREKRVAPP
jgi:hypothetical protein